jgi:hypothetical protein
MVFNIFFNKMNRYIKILPLPHICVKRHEVSQVLSRPVVEGAKYGSIAGLIATWSISTAIAASELELGLPISTFYAIIGISLGSNDFISSAYLGFGSHLATGTILGAVIGGLAVRVEMRKNITNIFDPYRSIHPNGNRNRRSSVARSISANNCAYYSAFNWQNY